MSGSDQSASDMGVVKPTVLDRSTKVNLGAALGVIIVMVGAAATLFTALQDIRQEVSGLRLELAKDYATKAELDKLEESARKHSESPGHAVLLYRVDRLEKELEKRK